MIDPQGCRGTDTRTDPNAAPIPLGRCIFEQARLDLLITSAYRDELGAVRNQPPRELVLGGPSWIHSDRFDVQAEADSASSSKARKDLWTCLSSTASVSLRRTDVSKRLIPGAGLCYLTGLLPTSRLRKNGHTPEKKARCFVRAPVNASGGFAVFKSTSKCRRRTSSRPESTRGTIDVLNASTTSSQLTTSVHHINDQF